MHCGLPVVIR